MYGALQKLLGLDKGAESTQPEHLRTVDEMIEEMVSGAVSKVGKPVTEMDKNEKLVIVTELLKRGVFVIKGSVERVAKSLAVSRFTVYNYLD